MATDWHAGYGLSLPLGLHTIHSPLNLLRDMLDDNVAHDVVVLTMLAV